MGGITSRENGKKGGRPRGAHTIQAEQGKALLIKMYLKNIKPINGALLKKAKEGDLQAIKELHDRVYGRPFQPSEVKLEGSLTISGVDINVRK